MQNDEYYLAQEFIEGRCVVAKPASSFGPATLIAQAFRNIEATLSRGGKVGHLSFADDGDGWYSVVVLDGSLKGATGIFKMGDTCFHLDCPGGRSAQIELPA